MQTFFVVVLSSHHIMPFFLCKLNCQWFSDANKNVYNVTYWRINRHPLLFHVWTFWSSLSRISLFPCQWLLLQQPDMPGNSLNLHFHMFSHTDGSPLGKRSAQSRGIMLPLSPSSGASKYKTAMSMQIVPMLVSLRLPETSHSSLYVSPVTNSHRWIYLQNFPWFQR